MLTGLAYAMVVVFMALIMTKRLPAVVALTLVPIGFGLLANALGLVGGDLGKMMMEGITKLAPTGVMLMFAILYFGVMIDAGLFDPVVRLVLRVVKGDPVRIVVGTAALAMAISLDGDGSTTYMLTCTAMMPLYQRLGLSRLVMACSTGASCAGDSSPRRLRAVKIWPPWVLTYSRAVRSPAERMPIWVKQAGSTRPSAMAS